MSDVQKNTPLRSRRQILKILAIGSAAGLMSGLGIRGRSRNPAVTRSRSLMGTVVNLTVIGDDVEAAEAAVTATLGRMSELESRLSRYRPESEVSRLNRTGRIENASDELLELLRLSDRISRLGEGAFDVTIQPVLDLYRRHLEDVHGLPAPAAIECALQQVDYRSLYVEERNVMFTRPAMAITLDGIGKGYIVDQAVAALKQRGFSNVLVEAGGDLVASGARAPGTPWRIGVRSPRSGIPKLETRFDARDRAVTTSGDYMQPFTPDFAQHHIIDPRTGSSAPELASSTVTAPTASLADGLSTLTMALGTRRSLEILEELPDCEGYFVSKDLGVTKTTGFVTA